jgi:hypothetical protein
VETTQFGAGNEVVVMMLITQGAQPNRSLLEGMLSGTRFDRELARRVEPPRMRVGEISARSWTDVAARATGDRTDAEMVANINGFDATESVPPSLLLKLPQAVAGD